ncbi:unnamed protein product [Acanthoscelides obtectus]|uniref:Uncharacterized protein n=1 Tax=Acanthoscelides obtectus TaxID=200917 RepID=A0A9P0KRS5_ACAOB|nr:unnamed protein product [Acanthoscelides obtectus]CAK1681481.1 O-acetyl-ADP-ribose deacetylase 1 [Acanthoscelides obtectus]
MQFDIKIRTDFKKCKARQRGLPFEKSSEIGASVGSAGHLFEAAANANGWSSAERATALTLALRGDAAAILQRIAPEEQEVYEQLVGHLEMRYGQSHLEHVYHTQLKNRFQNSGESLQEFEADIARKFGRVHQLRQSNPEVGEVLQITGEGTNRKMFYLVTEKASYQKPNYEDVWNALCSLREVLLAEGLRKLAIPKLACGLDNLHCRIIRSMLEVVFRGIGGTASSGDIFTCHASVPKIVNFRFTEWNENLHIRISLLCGHHDHSAVLLPDHSPEITDGRWQTSLGGDVAFSGITITPTPSATPTTFVRSPFHVVGVDIVRAGN